MHFLLGLAIVLAVTGVVLVLVAIAHRGWARIIVGLLGGAALGLTFSIWALLRFAEPTVCVQLGGDYVRNGSDLVCRNEWGGNGNNDPGQSWVPWA